MASDRVVMAREEWDRIRELKEENARMRALLKRAHDRDKWLGELPPITWYDDVARYFKGQVPSDPALAGASDEELAP